MRSITQSPLELSHSPKVVVLHTGPRNLETVCAQVVQAAEQGREADKIHHLETLVDIASGKGGMSARAQELLLNLFSDPATGDRTRADIFNVAHAATLRAGLDATQQPVSTVVAYLGGRAAEPPGGPNGPGARPAFNDYLASQLACGDRDPDVLADEWSPVGQELAALQPRHKTFGVWPQTALIRGAATDSDTFLQVATQARFFEVPVALWVDAGGGRLLPVVAEPSGGKIHWHLLQTLNRVGNGEVEQGLQLLLQAVSEDGDRTTCYDAPYDEQGSAVRGYQWLQGLDDRLIQVRNGAPSPPGGVGGMIEAQREEWRWRSTQQCEAQAVAHKAALLSALVASKAAHGSAAAQSAMPLFLNPEAHAAVSPAPDLSMEIPHWPDDFPEFDAAPAVDAKGKPLAAALESLTVQPPLILNSENAQRWAELANASLASAAASALAGGKPVAVPVDSWAAETDHRVVVIAEPAGGNGVVANGSPAGKVIWHVVNLEPGSLQATRLAKQLEQQLLSQEKLVGRVLAHEAALLADTPALRAETLAGLLKSIDREVRTRSGAAHGANEVPARPMANTIKEGLGRGDALRNSLVTGLRMSKPYADGPATSAFAEMSARYQGGLKWKDGTAAYAERLVAAESHRRASGAIEHHGPAQKFMQVCESVHSAFESLEDSLLLVPGDIAQHPLAPCRKAVQDAGGQAMAVQILVPLELLMREAHAIATQEKELKPDDARAAALVSNAGEALRIHTQKIAQMDRLIVELKKVQSLPRESIWRRIARLAIPSHVLDVPPRTKQEAARLLKTVETLRKELSEGPLFQELVSMARQVQANPVAALAVYRQL